MNWQDQLSALHHTLPQESAEPITAEDPAVASTTITHPRLDIIYERKGRAGHPATRITGFTLPHDQLSALATKLKSRLGCGGSFASPDILLLGDRRTAAQALLQKLGYKARII